MKRTNLWLIFIIAFIPLAAISQKKPAKKPVAQKPKTEKIVAQKPDVVADEKKVREIISFLEYMLNTLGNSSTPTRDKEVLITESYAKIFRDSKVQVEDDLDEERMVITNKDIVAYLKDVNFFFNNVRFEFTIENIKSSVMSNGQYFYKVSTTRNLTGTTSDRKAVNSTQPRYIEINYNPKDQDLKIVSIYTKEFNEKEALTNWWKGLSYEWQSIFKKKLNLSDSVRLSDIKRITSLESLDISNNQYILSIDPLAQLLSLRALNLSQTSVGDLTPIRNLTELTELNVSNTNVKNLLPLKYSSNLARLDISNTPVDDISVLEKMPNLQTLDISNTLALDFAVLTNLTALQNVNLSSTKISDLSPLDGLSEMTNLNISNTPVQDITPLNELNGLLILDIDSTQVRSVQALGKLENLSVLSANHTPLADLTPLQKLKNLKKIYCDKTPIKREAAEAFMAINPGTLVIFDSEDLKVWWNILSPPWQKTLSKTASITLAPSKEELAKIPLIDSIDLGNTNIDNVEPLRKLQRLRVVSINKTNVTDLSPLTGHKEIEYLDISETGVTNISVVNNFKKLKVLRADNSKVANVEVINLPNLEKLYADKTTVQDILARDFLERNPKCLLMYKSEKLNAWWATLPSSWKNIFQDQLKIKDTTRETLHQLVERESLTISDAPISDLSALSEFTQLKSLHLSGTALVNISPVDNIKLLKSLHVSHSPLQSIESLSVLTDLEDLDISNTPLEDIYELWKLKKLKKLNCSGTQLKRLDALEKMESLEYLDCSNTNVSKLSPLDYLPLKTLKCYNTKVSTRIIENFKAAHPDCNVIYYR